MSMWVSVCMFVCFACLAYRYVGIAMVPKLERFSRFFFFQCDERTVNIEIPEFYLMWPSRLDVNDNFVEYIHDGIGNKFPTALI